MKYYFIILVLIVSTCNAQDDLKSHKNSEIIRYYSEKCKQYLNYEREYLNDSLYVEKHGDVSDSLLLTETQLYKIHMGGKVKIIDINRDFGDKEKKYEYFYYGLSAHDTSKRKGESEVQFNLRLSQSIVVYVPVKMTTLDGRVMYSYYIMGNCYPITTACIKSKIANGQYGIIYFEKGIGFTGHSAANAKCTYLITNESYFALTQRRKLHS